MPHSRCDSCNRGQLVTQEHISAKLVEIVSHAQEIEL